MSRREKKDKSIEIEIQLKKINRKIWWLETKIDWLRFVSGRSVSESLTYFLIIIPLFFVYLILDKYLISDFLEYKFAKYFVVIFLILLSWCLMRIFDKKIFIRIEFLDKKLKSLYKERLILSRIVNYKF